MRLASKEGNKARWLGYLFVLIWHLRIYPLASKLHRFLFDGAARGTPLPTFQDTQEIVPYLHGMVWRPDSWIDFGDSICTPEMVWWRYLNAADHKIGDCDEYAVWLAATINKSIRAGVWEDRSRDPLILTNTWMEPGGHITGHNVCLLRRIVEVGSTGVWNYGYMDYDAPIWCGSPEQVVEAIRKRYAERGSVGIGWALHTWDLKFVGAYRG